MDESFSGYYGILSIGGGGRRKKKFIFVCCGGEDEKKMYLWLSHVFVSA